MIEDAGGPVVADEDAADGTLGTADSTLDGTLGTGSLPIQVLRMPRAAHTRAHPNHPDGFRFRHTSLCRSTRAFFCAF